MPAANVWRPLARHISGIRKCQIACAKWDDGARRLVKAFSVTRRADVLCERRWLKKSMNGYANFIDCTANFGSQRLCYGFSRLLEILFSYCEMKAAWVVARLFIADNAMTLRFDEIEAIQIMLRLASGEASEQELAQWFRQRTSDPRGEF
jgi:hypothetical protein